MSRVDLTSRKLPILVSPAMRRWLATLAASFVTAYGLDVFATAMGLLLVASGWLVGIDYPTALAFLALSYVAWGTGIWTILRANWELLQRTGTSTNLFSKAGHDLALRLGWSLRLRRAATHTGYVLTDLAKEAPYYIGAAGAAIFSDSIGAIDAIIFLAGANSGAAGYGFLQSYGMRVFVRRISRKD